MHGMHRARARTDSVRYSYIRHCATLRHKILSKNKQKIISPNNPDRHVIAIKKAMQSGFAWDISPETLILGAK